MQFGMMKEQAGKTSKQCKVSKIGGISLRTYASLGLQKEVKAQRDI